MAEFTFQIFGLDTLASRVGALRSGSAPERTAARSLFQQGERIMTASRSQVPVRYGILRASGFVEIPEIVGSGFVRVSLGYGGAAQKYARSVHENPRAGQTGGLSPQGKRYKRYATTGKWHFLSDPFRAWIASGGPDIIKNDIKAAVLAEVKH